MSSDKALLPLISYHDAFGMDATTDIKNWRNLPQPLSLFHRKNTVVLGIFINTLSVEDEALIVQKTPAVTQDEKGVTQENLVCQANGLNLLQRLRTPGGLLGSGRFGKAGVAASSR